MEEKIAEICALYVSVEGIPKTIAFGVSSTDILQIESENEEIGEEDLDITATTSKRCSTIELPPSKRKRPESLQNILKDHLESEASTNEAMKNSMEKIVNCITEMQKSFDETGSNIQSLYSALEKQNSLQAKFIARGKQ